ncbi:MAG: sigma-70 family RNA polymerase sigma factor [Planctomycetota bacterium]
MGDEEDRPGSKRELLRETGRLRRLARGLLADRGLAEDVVQDAWLAALRRPPRAGWALGAWLGGAVRRLVRQRAREEERRRRREERAARAEGSGEAIDTGERLEVLRALVDAVEALAEPYRTAVVLRFFAGLPPREIARRRGVPPRAASGAERSSWERR